MFSDPKHQLSLFDDDPIEEGLTALRGGTASETICASRLTKIFLGKRGSHKSYVHALFCEILPRHESSNERADILTHHLLGFPAEEAHAFAQKPHSTLGAIWEHTVTTIYEQAFPGQLSSEWGKHLKKLTGQMKPRSGDKVTAEYYLDRIAFELKYRSGSYENTRKQSITANYIRAMGLQPLMLCLRPSPNTAEFRRAGWTVLEADDALEKIWQDTGIDVEAVICMVGKQARIAQIREAGRQKMYHRLGEICTGHYNRSQAHISGAVHDAIATDQDALKDIMRRALKAGTLQDAVEDVFAAAHAATSIGVQDVSDYSKILETGRALLDPQRAG